MTQLSAAIDWLDTHINYERSGPLASSPGSATHDPDRRLRHLRRLMELMGEPQTLYPSLHITGTNGKTSTARIVTALVMASGLSVGTYTSPHLERINERIAINGESIADEDLAEVLDSVRLLEPLLGDDLPSYFEIVTAAAFRQFADAPVDVGVIEVGVGGKWDATNVVDGLVNVITSIGLDHMNYLGPTRAHIAKQKAGILKPGGVAVIGEPDDEFDAIWEASPSDRVLKINRDYELLDNNVAVGGRMLDIRTPKATYEGLFLSLHGSFQGYNAATALTAVEAFFDEPLSQEVVVEAFGAVQSPGRMEVAHRQPLCLLDGAHNNDGAAALAHTLKEEFAAAASRILVVGMLRTHDPRELLAELADPMPRLVFACTAPSPRAVPASEIADAARSLSMACVVVEDVALATNEALAAANDDDLVVVTGSLYVVGAARSAIAAR